MVVDGVAAEEVVEVEAVEADAAEGEGEDAAGLQVVEVEDEAPAVVEASVAEEVVAAALAEAVDDNSPRPIKLPTTSSSIHIFIRLDLK